MATVALRHARRLVRDSRGLVAARNEDYFYFVGLAREGSHSVSQKQHPDEWHTPAHVRRESPSIEA
jgi:hypothetical protein